MSTKSNAMGRSSKTLYILRESTSKLGEVEGESDNPDAPPRYPRQVLEAARAEADKAHGELRTQLQLRRFYLTPKAINVVEGYFAGYEGDEMADTHYPHGLWAWLAASAYLNFHELAQVDLGQRSGLWWRWRRFKRWTNREWHIGRVHFQGWLWRVQHRSRRGSPRPPRH